METNLHTSTASTPYSFSFFSATAIQKIPHCVGLKRWSLRSCGYKSFKDWNSDPNHVYIGRDMTHYVAGAVGSKWRNPFIPKKASKNALNKCLKRYEDHIRGDPDLFNAVMELEGKELGCWCKPSRCHGDILIKLFKEKQNATLYSPKPIFALENGDNIKCHSNTQHIYPPITWGGHTSQSEEIGLLINTPSAFPPLRLNGGGDMSYESQSSNILVNHPPASPSNQDSQCFSTGNDPQIFVSQDDVLTEQDIREILFDAGYTIDDINDIIASKLKSNESDCSEILSCVGVNMSLFDKNDDPIAILKDLKDKNADRPIIAHLNINSLSSKFEPLTEIVKDSIDFLLVTESKLDDTFPNGQFPKWKVFPGLSDLIEIEMAEE